MVRVSASGRVRGLYWCRHCKTWSYATRDEGKKVIRHMNRKGQLTVYRCPVADVFHVGRPEP